GRPGTRLPATPRVRLAPTCSRRVAVACGSSEIRLLAGVVTRFALLGLCPAGVAGVTSRRTRPGDQKPARARNWEITRPGRGLCGATNTMRLILAGIKGSLGISLCCVMPRPLGHAPQPRLLHRRAGAV